VRLCNRFWTANIFEHSGNYLQPLAVGENAMPDNADFFVGWGTLSLINAGLAQAKGRSGLLWWLASMFLGPIATFIIVVSSPEIPDR